MISHLFSFGGRLPPRFSPVAVYESENARLSPRAPKARLVRLFDGQMDDAVDSLAGQRVNAHDRWNSGLNVVTSKTIRMLDDCDFREAQTGGGLQVVFVTTRSTAGAINDIMTYLTVF